MSVFATKVARKGKPIQIQERSLGDGYDDTEDESFVTVTGGSVKALVCTPRGKVVFDGVDAEEDVTHQFDIVWPGFDVTTENWILLKSKRYRVLWATNCCESDKKMIIECTERGDSNKDAANA